APAAFARGPGAGAGALPAIAPPVRALRQRLRARLRAGHLGNDGGDRRVGAGAGVGGPEIPPRGGPGAAVGPRTRPHRAPALDGAFARGHRVDPRRLARATLRASAMGDAEPRANGCIDQLEDEGIFRVGRADQTLDLRLRFPPAFAGAVFRASGEESLSAAFLWSIMRLESGYNPAAR